MKFYVYILFSIARDAFYIGCTGQSLQETLRAHNANPDGNSGYAGEWMLMHSEEFYSKDDALNRQKEIQNWKTRARIEKLISAEH